MRIVGLTGGIASGKSTVSDLFRSSGVPVVDADIVARDVVKKGTPGWRKVAAAFGDDVLLENGEINRSRLGQIVFSDTAKRQLLNRLLAPHISSGIFWETMKLWVKGCRVIVLDIPLLFEVKMDRWTKPTIVVWVNPETQLQRLMARDGISEEEARNKIGAQTSLDWKKTKADIVVDNSGSIEDTRTQFQKVLKQVAVSLSWKEFAFSRESLVFSAFTPVKREREREREMQLLDDPPSRCALSPLPASKGSHRHERRSQTEITGAGERSRWRRSPMLEKILEYHPNLQFFAPLTALPTPARFPWLSKSPSLGKSWQNRLEKVGGMVAGFRC